MNSVRVQIDTTVPHDRLWAQYISAKSPQGVPPHIYTDLKIAFYSGLIQHFSEIIKIGEELDDVKGKLDLDAYHGELESSTGRVRAGFETWISMAYSKDLSNFQRHHLEDTFLNAMKIGWDVTLKLSGPLDEPDELGEDRMYQFQMSLVKELERMVAPS